MCRLLLLITGFTRYARLYYALIAIDRQRFRRSPCLDASRKQVVLLFNVLFNIYRAAAIARQGLEGTTATVAAGRRTRAEAVHV